MTKRQGENPSHEARPSATNAHGNEGHSLDEGDVILGKYIVKSKLGAGGMGQVFRALHIRLARDVAVKILPDNGSEENALRFEREAALMTRVRHPNVVEILDFGFLDGRVPCIVMELVEGEMLSARLLRSRAQPWSDAVRIVLGVLDGLEAVHEAQILHRDLKPSNVAIAKGPPEIVKLLDFGIARSLTGESDRRVTRTGNIVGSLDYMSPEALVNDPIDVRTDVYAAGMMLFEMLHGEYPFLDDAMAAAFRRLSNDPPLPVAPEGFDEVPPALAKLAQRAIARDRKDRPETADAFAQELREFVVRARRAQHSAAVDSDSDASRATAQAPSKAARPSSVDAEAKTVDAPNPPPAAKEKPRDAAQPSPAAAPKAKPKRVLGGIAPQAPRPPEIPPPPDPVVLPKAPREQASPSSNALAAKVARPQFVVLARLPEEKLASLEERRWLAELVRDAGKAYAIGSHIWCAVLFAIDAASAEKRSLVLLDALEARYSKVAVVGGAIFDPHFALESAKLSMDAKLPEPLPALVAQLASIAR